MSNTTHFHRAQSESHTESRPGREKRRTCRPSHKGRGATDADIEVVPTLLLRDLFDGVTHMDALEIDADAL